MKKGKRKIKKTKPVGSQVLRNLAQPGQSFSSNSSTLARKEFWNLTVSADSTGATAQAWRFCPGKSNIMVLDSLARVFDNYIVDYVDIEIKGLGATTSKVVLFIGMDFSPTASETTQEKILRLRPSAAVQPYGIAHLKASKGQLMRRVMYIANSSTASDDSDAFTLCMIAPAWTTSDKTQFCITISYRVTFYNPAQNFS
jgi:hypothetical protein